MRLIRGNRLAHKMTLMALLASSLASGTLLATLMVFDGLSSRTLLHRRLSTLADVVGQNSTAALNFSDPAAAVEVLEALRAEPPVVSACLYDLSGDLFAQYQRAQGQQGCPANLGQVPPLEGKYSSVLRPVLRHSEVVGTLLLNSDLQELTKRWRQLLLVAAVLAVLALTIGGAAGLFLQRKISGPIFGLARAMQLVTTEQNFATRVAVSGTDEIAELGTGFNAMLSELERRNAEKKSFEAKLEFQALNDALTGLPNRRLFSDRLSQTLAVASREARIVALLYIDLDGFKLVNDSLGHPVGDALLVQVATRLQSRVRKSDTLARLGGDEFTVILGAIHAKEDAAIVAKSLLDVLVAPFFVDEHEITIAASIGISVFPENAKDAADLLQQADSAMYSAKRNGKNRAMYFTPDLGTWVRERLNLENQLRGAVVRDEIKIHYQPEFDVTSNRLIRFEALARWIHPTLGMISPTKFIPIAEETGLIVTIGAYVMARACAEAVSWQAISPHPVQVAVNVSSVQFARDSFMEEVVEVLKSTGLRPQLLQLELTESVMLRGVHRSAETMKRLGALGISLAIDDFGTGYSCLSYLPALPFDALKIDRSFVKDLNSKPQSVAMVHSLVTLAHNIGMRVIVEGVEEPEQLELIKQLGGTEIQGYLLGRPTPNPSAQLLSYLNQQGAVGAVAGAGLELHPEVPVDTTISETVRK
jgi:diguanylate cyclase (GGDEF)-like protein